MTDMDDARLADGMPDRLSWVERGPSATSPLCRLVTPKKTSSHIGVVDRGEKVGRRHPSSIPALRKLSSSVRARQKVSQPPLSGP